MVTCQRRSQRAQGFTLVELLVVIAIIGILAAIAIPQFAEYKTRAFNSRSQTDLRNGLTAEEAYFVDNERYATCDGAACAGSQAGGLPGLVISDGVQIAFLSGGTSNERFSGASCHDRGDKTYEWSTDNNTMSNNGNACAGVPAAPALN